VLNWLRGTRLLAGLRLDIFGELAEKSSRIISLVMHFEVFDTVEQSERRGAWFPNVVELGYGATRRVIKTLLCYCAS